MKGIIKVLIFLSALLCVLNLATAGGSKTIAVSCSIPAIPGVNAPPFPADIELAHKQGYASAENEVQKNQEMPLIIAEERGDRQTIYSR